MHLRHRPDQRDQLWISLCPAFQHAVACLFILVGDPLHHTFELFHWLSLPVRRPVREQIHQQKKPCTDKEREGKQKLLHHSQDKRPQTGQQKKHSRSDMDAMIHLLNDALRSFR